MSKVVYEGSVAGLHQHGKKQGAGGDAGSPFDYTVYCTCEREGKPTHLGPLGRFSLNADGVRSVLCNVCQHVTIIDKAGQVKAYVPFTLVPKH
jgi:hypothetical protein